MDHACAHQLGPVLLVKGIQIRLVLEIVGIQIAAIQRLVGNYIVGVLLNLQIISLGCHHRLGRLQNLGVRSRAGAHHDGL